MRCTITTLINTDFFNIIPFYTRPVLPSDFALTSPHITSVWLLSKGDTLTMLPLNDDTLKILSSKGDTLKMLPSKRDTHKMLPSIVNTLQMLP